MLNIEDVDKLKITKVKSWAILFDYDDKHYLLHSDSEEGEGSGQTLYERILNENGNYVLYAVESKWYLEGSLISDYVRLSKTLNRIYSSTIVYSQLSKRYFAYKLTLNGLACGCMKEIVKRNRDKISDYRAQIFITRKVISNLEAKIRETAENIF